MSQSCGELTILNGLLWIQLPCPGLVRKALRDKTHYSDIIMGSMASQITSITIIYSSVYSGADQRKHQSSTPLAFVLGIHRRPVSSPHKGPVTRKMFPFDDVIMLHRALICTWGRIPFEDIAAAGQRLVMCVKFTCWSCLSWNRLKPGFYQIIHGLQSTQTNINVYTANRPHDRQVVTKSISYFPIW